ncbi:GNAT family N-acetyltransferase [Flavobacterium sp.]|jgi:GNAT superfamily N-acetyltransferase|uniref:GNAT family N-acetyltransferase n=1 Tax=Flavobacterium sp. TaxID=239 RepID=UPI0037849F16
MFSIVSNTDSQFTAVRAIAFEVWPKTYGTILTATQLEYMLDMMYSVAALQEQSTLKQHHFVLIYVNDEAVGFASYEHNANESGKTKIHKIYILSSQQGKGTGKALVGYIEQKALVHGDKVLFLNVNKYNAAIQFYRKTGFRITNEEIIDIGNGYVMDDYVMEKLLAE